MPFLGATHPADAPPPRARLKRWGLRALAAVAGVVALVVLAVVVLVHSLDQPWLKRRIQALARSSAGVEVDYRVAQVALFSGATIEGLTVRSPAEFQTFAPDLLQVGRLDVRWRVGSLLGKTHSLSSVGLANVALAVVVDEHGRTSLDALQPPESTPPPPAPPPVPLSQQTASLLGGAFPVAQIDVSEVSLALIRTEHAEAIERTQIDGVALTVHAGPAEGSAKGSRALINVGTPARPLDLRIARTRGTTDARAHAELWLTLDATAPSVTAALDLRVPEQTFAPSAAADQWLHAEATARFDPGAGRTDVTLAHTEAGDGAASAEASIEIPDHADPIVRRARADADLAQILRWLPPGLVPATAQRAQLHCRIESLVAGRVVRLADAGTATVDLDLANVEADAGAGRLHVGGAKVSLRAQPAEGSGVAGRGSVQLQDARFTNGGDRFAADRVALDFDGRQGSDGRITAHAGFGWGRVESSGASPALATDGDLQVDVKDLLVATSDPLATKGEVTAALGLASLDIRAGGSHLLADALKVRTHAPLAGHAPYEVDLAVLAGRLRLFGRTGVGLVDAPLSFETQLRDVFPDLADPAASRGVVHVKADLDKKAIEASVDLTKKDSSLEYGLSTSARTLHPIRVFLPPAVAKDAPWDEMALAVHASGHVDHIGRNPSVDQSIEVNVERPRFGKVAARSLALAVHSKGNAIDHEGTVDLHLQSLAVDGGAAKDEHITLSANVQRERPALQLELKTEGRAAADLKGSVSFDSARKAVPYDLEGHLGGLAPLAPFLAQVKGLDGLDLSQLEIGFSAHGALLGVVSAVGQDGALQLEPRPSLTAALEGTADLRVAHLQWSHGDTAVITPAVGWKGAFRSAGGLRTVESHLAVDALHLDLGPNDVDLGGIRDDSTATLRGDLANPETKLTQRTAIRAIEQDLVPAYPLGDFTLAANAERSPDDVIRIEDLQVANGAGGTTLDVKGNIDLGDGRRTLSITTTVGQDLARLARVPDRFHGRGEVSAEANVTSPDFALLRVRAAVKAKDVFLELPRAGISLEAANGEIPITVALEAGKTGVALRADEKRSPYSMLRFADQHPLLSRSGFLSVGSLKTPLVTIAPLVGNLEIDQNVISLRQFEMGVRGGSITGQCGLNWDGPKSTVEIHVRASGVQSSHGEPFDGNIAVVIAAGDRTVEGRAEVLRIGERHLLDLLDMQDPLHTDKAMNRIRTALTIGYPDKLRLVFDHGFASARLELGGLARLISIGELRGIPMGPLVDKFLAPVLDPKDSQ
jgi:translocation and assembly module TamB